MSRAPFASVLMLALPLLAGCATTPRPRPQVVSQSEPTPTGWRSIASPQDRARIDALEATLARVRAAAPARLVAKEGPLLDPSAAQPMPLLPPGPYYCRLVRFGGPARLRTFAPDFCYVQSGDQGMSFTKQTGSTLPEGWIYPDSDTRQIFLGSFRSVPGTAALKYGEDPAQDIAGVLERVSPFRWRLILARAKTGATLDLYELVPVTPAVPGRNLQFPPNDI